MGLGKPLKSSIKTVLSRKRVKRSGGVAAETSTELSQKGVIHFHQSGRENQTGGCFHHFSPLPEVQGGGGGSFAKGKRGAPMQEALSQSNSAKKGKKI